MSISRLGFANTVVSGTLSAGSSTLPVTNLASQLGSPATAWQTVAGVITSAAGAWVRGNAVLANTSFGAFGVFRTNLTASSTMRARVYSDAYSTLVYDSGTITTNILPGFAQALIVPATPVIGQYWQLDFDDTGNPDNFINIPLMYVGSLFNPIVGMSANSAIQTITGNVSTATRFGSIYMSSYWQARQQIVSLGYLRDIEMTSMLSLDATARDGTNILFIPDVTGSPNRDAVFGICNSGPYTYSFAHKDARNWNGTILERI